MKGQNTNPIQLLQPYLVLCTDDYQRIIENRNGISHFYEFRAGSGEDGALQAVPDGSVDLLFGISENQVRAFIGGTVFQAKAWELPEEELYFGIRFFPGQCRIPADLKIEEIIDADIEISDDHIIKEFSRQLLEKKTARERSALFREWYCRHYSLKEDAAVMLEPYIRNRIYETRGTVSMKQLAEDTGYSACYIRRVFSRVHGVPPKVFGKFVRFQNVLEYLTYGNRQSRTVCNDMGGIAMEYGYSDQPHMIHEFKHYTGTTPEAYMRLVRGYKF